MLRKIIVILFFLWLTGFFWFVERLPTYDEQRETPKGDVIVALTGGKGRITDAFTLLHAKAAPKLFITGVGTDVTLAELVAQDVPEPSRKALHHYQNHVHLGYVARTTAGNAREVNGWMVAHPVKSMVLVTSNYHMPRSLYLFRHAFPEVDITPSPSFGPTFSSGGWWRNRDVLALTFSEYHKLLMSYIMYGVLGAQLV